MDQGDRVQQVAQVDEGPGQNDTDTQTLKRGGEGDVSHVINSHWTGQQNTELQSNQTEAGTALAMAMVALYYCFVGALPHHLPPSGTVDVIGTITCRANIS